MYRLIYPMAFPIFLGKIPLISNARFKIFKLTE